MADDVVIINDGLEQRTSKTGKQRFTIRIKSEPVVHNFDPKALGAPVAQAIAHHFRERVKAIAAVAAPATIKARQVAEKAFKAGKPWATQRYSGGRTGPMPPNQSNRLFNDSGRFAETITANGSSDGHWRVNVAANRLSGDAGMVERIWNRLVQLVPEFGDPALLLQNDVIRASIRQAQDNLIKKARERTDKLQVSLAKALFQTARQVGDLLSA